jgi:hypothetical protein
LKKINVGEGAVIDQKENEQELEAEKYATQVRPGAAPEAKVDLTLAELRALLKSAHLAGARSRDETWNDKMYEIDLDSIATLLMNGNHSVNGTNITLDEDDKKMTLSEKFEEIKAWASFF